MRGEQSDRWGVAPACPLCHQPMTESAMDHPRDPLTGRRVCQLTWTCPACGTRLSEDPVRARPGLSFGPTRGASSMD